MKINSRPTPVNVNLKNIVYAIKYAKDCNIKDKRNLLNYALMQQVLSTDKYLINYKSDYVTGIQSKIAQYFGFDNIKSIQDSAIQLITDKNYNKNLDQMLRYTSSGGFFSSCTTYLSIHMAISLCFGLKIDSKIKMLEIGCGTGSYLKFVADTFKNIDCTGIDLNPVIVQCANDQGFQAIKLADARNIPSKKNSYDVIISHLFHETQYLKSFAGDDKNKAQKIFNRILEEVYRTLKHGGYYISENMSPTGDPGFDQAADIVNKFQAHEQFTFYNTIDIFQK